ncbi:MAG: chloride channel protein, partial [Bacteroidales bacterium]|nr:chloride channel protein [Bacteroidales bacterium]
MILAAIIGFISGIIAFVIKGAVHLIQLLLKSSFFENSQNYLYIIFPAIGILLTVLFIKYIIRKKVDHGIPGVLYSISKQRGFTKSHNLFSSIITSAFTVGFGGSVGLEGPTVATGTAWGSNIGRFFRLNYRQVLLLLACAGAGAMSAIFKAPIAAIVFVLEVIMLDLTIASLLPLLFASVSAVIVSYLFLGMDVLYPIEIIEKFNISEIPYYILLGVIAGLVSVYFTRVYKTMQAWFDKQSNSYYKWIIGVGSLGLLIFLFPSLYGEGYEAINGCLNGDNGHLFNNSLFYDLREEFWAVLVLLASVILLKIVATSLTFGAGGVGGIFAPVLFMGVNTGMLFAQIINLLGIRQINTNNFALIGMAGLIAGVLHAPLTGIFLIADISGGYKLFVPLMITATFAYIIVRTFNPNSVYHIQLATRKELLTHDKDANVLQMLEVKKLIETDFEILSPNATLRDLTAAISRNHRNLFPVVDSEGKMVGMVKMDDVRSMIFNHELYDKV